MCMHVLGVAAGCSLAMKSWMSRFTAGVRVRHETDGRGQTISTLSACGSWERRICTGAGTAPIEEGLQGDIRVQRKRHGFYLTGCWAGCLQASSPISSSGRSHIPDGDLCDELKAEGRPLTELRGLQHQTRLGSTAVCLSTKLKMLRQARRYAMTYARLGTATYPSNHLISPLSTQR